MKFQPNKKVTQMRKMTRMKLLRKRKFTFLKRIKTTRMFDNHHVEEGRPVKIVHNPPPKIKYPKELQVYLHDKEVIEYEGKHQFFVLPTKKILTYKGDGKISVPQMPINVQQTPQLVTQHLQTIYSTNLWLYRGRRITKWHYDGHDNFLYILEGKKTIYLAEPTTLRSQSAFSLFNNHLAKKKNKLKEARGNIWKVVLEKGECLYIPKGWWHYVISTGDPNIGINFWGNSVSKLLKSMTETEKGIVLKQLIYQKCEQELQKRVNEWESQDEKFKEYLRKTYFMNLVHEGF